MPSSFRGATAVVRAVLSLAGQSPNASAPLSPPARRAERALASAAHRGFQISLLISFALLLGLMTLDTRDAWLAWLKLAFGATMMGEGLLLAFDWRGARRLTLWQLRRRQSDAHASLLARLTWTLASLALQLLGVIWLGAGLLTAIIALQNVS